MFHYNNVLMCNIKSHFIKHLHVQKDPGGYLLILASETRPAASSNELLLQESQGGRRASQAWLALLFQPPSYRKFREILSALFTKSQSCGFQMTHCFTWNIPQPHCFQSKRRFFNVIQLRDCQRKFNIQNSIIDIP